MRSFLKQTTYFTIFCLLVFACANQGSITGGLKDEEPPQLEYAIPANELRNIQPKVIEFGFDENIKIVEVNKNLLISPAQKNRPIIKQKAKSFTIQLVDTLLPNTTYTLNFGNAIQDLNEGNVLAGFRYVFSTGDEIDKGRISGYATDAYLGEIEDVTNIWALLYNNLSDTVVQTEFPNYISPISEEDFSFSFENVAEGEYQVFVIKDQNASYTYDLPNESIAFVDSTFTVDTLPQQIEDDFFLFEQKDTISRVVSFKQRDFSFMLHTSQPIDNYELRDSLNVLNSYSFNQYQDSIVYFLPFNSTKNQIYLFDNQKNTMIDTLSLRGIKEFEVQNLTPKVVEEELSNEPLRLRFRYPIASFNVDKTVVLEDSLFVAGGVEFVRDSLLATQYVSTNEWLPDREYIVTLDDSTFTSIYDNFSDSIQFNVSVLSEQELSSAKLQLSDKPFTGQLIIQVVQNEQIIEEFAAKEPGQTLNLTKMQPGDYNIVIIKDENSNGVWDTGSYKERIQPEKIIRYEQPITLRANWDTELMIEF